MRELEPLKKALAAMPAVQLAVKQFLAALADAAGL